MTTLTVPDPADAQARISYYLAALPLGVVSDARRAQIMNNCLGPIVLLIEAVQLAGAAGPDEEMVLIQFIRALYAQAETVKRDKYFNDLMEKLSAHRTLQLPGDGAA
ncbi:MAG: hypothetical protein JWN23_2830 [Rhodocyclales bacterium]|nr:hypothetical protein [Rhodocyclales bacterium]